MSTAVAGGERPRSARRRPRARQPVGRRGVGAGSDLVRAETQLSGAQRNPVEPVRIFEQRRVARGDPGDDRRDLRAPTSCCSAAARPDGRTPPGSRRPSSRRCGKASRGPLAAAARSCASGTGAAAEAEVLEHGARTRRTRRRTAASAGEHQGDVGRGVHGRLGDHGQELTPRARPEDELWTVVAHTDSTSSKPGTD